MDSVARNERCLDYLFLGAPGEAILHGTLLLRTLVPTLFNKACGTAKYNAEFRWLASKIPGERQRADAQELTAISKRLRYNSANPWTLINSLPSWKSPDRA